MSDRDPNTSAAREMNSDNMPRLDHQKSAPIVELVRDQVPAIPTEPEKTWLELRREAFPGNSNPTGILAAGKLLDATKFTNILNEARREFPKGHTILTKTGLGIITSIEISSNDGRAIVVLGMTQVKKQNDGRFLDKEGNLEVSAVEFELNAFKASNTYTVSQELIVQDKESILAVLTEEAKQFDAQSSTDGETQGDQGIEDEEEDLNLDEFALSPMELLRKRLEPWHLVIVFDKSQPNRPPKKFVTMPAEEGAKENEILITHAKNGGLTPETLALEDLAQEGLQVIVHPEVIAPGTDLMELLSVVTNQNEGDLEVDEVQEAITVLVDGVEAAVDLVDDDEPITETYFRTS